jgi:tetratricopeptide (TPR) repeat protein
MWYEDHPLPREVGRSLAAFIFVLGVCVAGFSSADNPVQQAYTRATHAMASGDYRAAVTDLRRCVQLEPGRAAFQFAYAYVLNRVGEMELARGAIMKCLKLQQDYPNANHLAGEIESSRNDFRTAVEYLEKARKQDPNNVDVLSSLGLAFVGLGSYADAATQFRRVTGLHPDFAPAHYNLGLALLNLGRAPDAEVEFRQALKLTPDYEKARVQLANSLLAQGREGNAEQTRQAVEVYRQTLQLDPDNLDSRFNLAFALTVLRDEQGALIEYHKVAQSKPDYPSVQFCLGYTEYKLKDWVNAKDHLRKALDQGTDNFVVRYCLGSALLQTGDQLAAKTQLEAAVKIEPGDPSPHFQLAKFYRTVGDAGRAAEEYSSFRKLSARKEAEWHVNALEGSAAAALKRGETEKGIDTLKEVYSARHDVSSARNLGLAYLENGKRADARHFLEEALKCSPEDAATHNYMGLLEAREGNLAQAQKEFEKSASLDPSFLDALYNAGLSSYELQQIDVAIKYFRAALARSDSPQVHRALALALADAGRADEAQQHLEDARRLQ